MVLLFAMCLLGQFAFAQVRLLDVDDKLVVRNNGNVGIGTISPGAKLHVRDGELRLDNNGQIFDMSIDDQGNFTLQRNGTVAAFFINDETNNVGIGISDPTARLQVKGDFRIEHASNNNSYKFEVDDQGDLNFVGDGGVVAIEVGDATGKTIFYGGTDVTTTSGGFIQLGAGDGLNLAMDSNEMQAHDNGAASQLFINHGGGDVLLCGLENGQVGIGITSIANLPDPSFLLAVDGKIASEEVMVQMSGNWPDYVFQKDYNLLKIDDLEKSIQINGHLPGMPSAKEVEEVGGFEIGDMQQRLLEKVEELSLYVIELNHKIKELEAANKELKK
jgi:hypothetical protein